MTFISGHWMHFISKTRQTVAGMSMTSQFHDFFGSNFWRVFDVWNHCAAWDVGSALNRQRMKVRALPAENSVTEFSMRSEARKTCWVFLAFFSLVKRNQDVEL